MGRLLSMLYKIPKFFKSSLNLPKKSKAGAWLVIIMSVISGLLSCFLSWAILALGENLGLLFYVLFFSCMVDIFLLILGILLLIEKNRFWYLSTIFFLVFFIILSILNELPLGLFQLLTSILILVLFFCDRKFFVSRG